MDAFTGTKPNSCTTPAPYSTRQCFSPMHRMLLDMCRTNSPSVVGTDTHTSISLLPFLDPSPSPVHAKEVPNKLPRSYRNLQSPTPQAEQLAMFRNNVQSPSDGMQKSRAHLRAYALAPAHCPHGQAVVDQWHSGIRVIPRGSCSRWRLRQRIPAWTGRPILCPLMPR
jgi:hypothetical protein